MHIHGSIPNVGSAGFYGVSNGERAAANRAAETRKRLLKAGESTEPEAGAEETVLVNQWMDARHSQVTADGEGHAGRAPDFG